MEPVGDAAYRPFNKDSRQVAFIYARSNCNAAMLPLAAELPAAVLADRLGIHTGTAAKWAHEANGNWTTYTADRSR